MSSNKTKFFILLIILSLSLSAPPPPQKPKPINEIIVDAPTIINLEKNQNSAFKRLDSNNNPTLQIENITSINTFYEDYKIEEHYMIIIPKNLPDGYIFTDWGISMGKNGIILEEFNCTCEILSKETGLVIPEIECITSFNLSKDESPIKLDYSFSLPNTALLKVNLKYKKNIDNEILYKTEWMYFPFILGFSFCNFTCVLSEGYKSLGLQNNILKKVSDNTYSFIGTNITETLYELIHFAPIKTLWKAKTEVYLYYPQKFTNKVWLTFPRYYRGGKLNNSFYKISSSLNDIYNEEDIIYQDLKLRVEIPAKEHERVSAKVETGFINDLRNDFIVYIPESYYEINITDIPQEIKDITQEVIRNNSDLPAYYSIGKFVHSYIKYDINDLGKRYTAKQILENRKGVCEHYTILYNTMLNSIGIKAMDISGWALQNAEISANDQTIGHAWTVALIDGKWIELDSTWGLFEGVPAGHIYKTLFTDSFSYSCYEHGNLYFGQNRTLQLYEDISDISDILTYETTITSTYKKIFSSTEEISSQSTSYTNNILTEDSENSDFIGSTKASNILSDKTTNEIQKERTTDLLYDKTNIPNTEGNSTKIQETNNEITNEISTYLISDKIFDKTRDIRTNRESSDLNNDSIDISNRVTSKITKKELSDIISEEIEYSSSSNEGIIKSTQTNIQPVNSKISTTDNLVIDSFSNTPLNTIINNSTTYPINSSVTNTIKTSDIIKTQIKIPLTTSSSYTKSTSSINNLETSISINSIPKSSLVTTEPSKNGTHIITTTFPETSIVNPDTTIQKNIKQSTQIIIPETKFNHKTTFETSLTNSPSTNSLTFSTNNPKISNIDTTTSYTTIEKDITSTTNINTTQITFPKSIHTDFTKTTNIDITKTNPTTTPWTYPSSTSSTKNPKTTLTTEQFTSSKTIQKTSNLSNLQTTPIIEKETGLTNKIDFSTNVNNHIDETTIETIPKSTKITNIEETPVINSPTTTIPKNIPTSIPRTTDETFSKNMLTTIYEKSDTSTPESTINNLEKNKTTTYPINSSVTNTIQTSDIIKTQTKIPLTTSSSYTKSTSSINNLETSISINSIPKSSLVTTEPSKNGTHIITTTFPETSIVNPDTTIQKNIKQSTQIIIPETKFNHKTTFETSLTNSPSTNSLTFSTNNPKISNIDTTTSYTTIEKDITSTTNINTTQITFPKSIHTDFTKTTNIDITKTNPTTTPWTYPSSTSSTKNPKTTLTTEQFTSSKTIQKTSNLSNLQTTPIIEKETGLTNKIDFSTNVNNHIDETTIETIPKSTKITNIEETPVINSPTTTIPKNIPTSIPRTTDETFSKNMLTTIYEKSDINTQESTINNLEKNITTTFAIIPTKPSETIIVSIPKNSTETKSIYLETISKITQAPSQETLDTKSPTSNIKTNPSPFPSTIPETIPKSNPEITTPIANSTLTVIPSIKTLPEISQSTIPKTIPKTFSTTTPSIPPKEIQTTIPLIMPTTIPKTIPHSNENIDKANIILSFRQIQNFTQNKNDNNITFYFYGLTTESKSKIPNSININVNLIKKNGEREDNIKTSFCELKDIKNNIYSSQAKYICTISKLKEKYHSLRYNSSTYIFGIPENEISLDPYMTQKYIKENKIEDATKVGIPTTFVIKSINHDTCKTNGIFTISGDISEEITQSIIFNIPLSETKDVMSSCNLTKNKIECKVDREINNNKISIEQMIIKENYKEILFISSAITKDKITCKNALYEDSTKKKNIDISFRQISHLSKFTNGFSFYLITLISSSYNKDYKINIKMNVYINKIKNEKNAICILENDAKSNGGLVQGNFKCTVSLSNDEYKNIDFTTITISNNNEDISGISDLDEITSNPYKTDEFIKEIKDKKSKGQKINELTDIIDYYSEKSNIIPILDIQSININDCHNKGKLYIIGKLSENINKKIKFDLPLTYPTEEIKCELDETKKNSRVTITCKSQNKFDNFDTIIIEPRLIKKKNQEIIFIKGKEVKFEGKKTCENYNTIKMHTTKKKTRK